MRSFYFLKGYNHAFNTTLEIEKNKPFQKKSKSKYINFDLKKKEYNKDAWHTSF